MTTGMWLAVVRSVYRPLYRSALRQALVGRLVDPHQPRGRRFLNHEVDALFAQTWNAVGRMATADRLERYRNRGSPANVFSIALLMASYRVLRSVGIDHDHAVQLCGDAGWRMYTQFARPAKTLAKLRARDPQARLNFIWRSYVRFPFTPAGPPGGGRPGYECQTRWASDAGYTTFTSCAPLNFVRQHIDEHGDDGELALFQHTYCAYDWPFVDFLVGRHAHYERPHTLSFGDDRCDMTWAVTAPARRDLPLAGRADGASATTPRSAS